VRLFTWKAAARHDLLKSLGENLVFDYASPTVVGDIVSAVRALGHGSITHALDAVGTIESPTSADLIVRCAGESAILSSVVLRTDRRFQMPVAMTKDV